jgi:hypothetical protein
MTYDVIIRHTNPLPSGKTAEHWFEGRRVEARSEEDAFLKIRHNSNDHIAGIASRHGRGLEPYSVDTGIPGLFTDARRPSRRTTGGDLRMG